MSNSERNIRISHLAGLPYPEIEMTILDEQVWWEAVLKKDAGMDGAFYYAVTTTGVYCRPSCPSRPPRRSNVLFFRNADAAEQAGYRACRRCQPRADLLAPIKRVGRYIEEHAGEHPTLAGLAARAGLSPSHLQRKFKAAFGMSPYEYAEACRTRSLKTELRQGSSVTNAIYEAGYGSSSRVYERTDARLGMTPAAYRQGGKGTRIDYAISASALGRVLLAATGRGVCTIRFGDDDTQLEADLRAEFPAAEVRRNQAAVKRWLDALLHHLRGPDVPLELPLDIRATAFQKKVWAHLRSIPAGRTESYGEVAAAIGEPAAARAVARACATNPVAVAIPCHRVVRGDGSSGGYRWGEDRKRALLQREAASVHATAI
jgi:AraC family transcriptional regulator of adaptative response/methylated-DNA-[protein]-cysteine methyltransferase